MGVYGLEFNLEDKHIQIGNRRRIKLSLVIYKQSKANHEYGNENLFSNAEYQWFSASYLGKNYGHLQLGQVVDVPQSNSVILFYFNNVKHTGLFCVSLFASLFGSNYSRLIGFIIFNFDEICPNRWNWGITANDWCFSTQSGLGEGVRSFSGGRGTMKLSLWPRECTR